MIEEVDGKPDPKPPEPKIDPNLDPNLVSSIDNKRQVDYRPQK